uniref:Uncharacterized protein n=1 Tax=Plectus sambesii TaxID=2011161 RepID=A0A914VQ20_9BILA
MTEQDRLFHQVLPFHQLQFLHSATLELVKATYMVEYLVSNKLAVIYTAIHNITIIGIHTLALLTDNTASFTVTIMEVEM